MKLGDIRLELPTMDSEAMMGQRRPVEGVVTYIHPEFRFYVVEFAAPAGYRFRETFYFQDRDPAGPPLPEDFRHRMLTRADRDRGKFHSFRTQAARARGQYR